MSQQAAVYQWIARIARQFPPLRASQAKVLAAFSWGVVASQRCTLRRVAEALPQWGKPDTVERRLQRFVANPRVDWQASATALAAWIVARLRSRAVMSYWSTRRAYRSISRRWWSVLPIGGAPYRWRGGVIGPAEVAAGASGAHHPPAGPTRPRLAAAPAHPRAGGPGAGHESGLAGGDCSARVVFPGPSPTAGPRPSRRPGARGGGVGGGPRHALAGGRAGLQESGLAGLLGRRPLAAGGSPAVAVSDQLAPCAGGLVWPADVGRGGVQGLQVERLAVAAQPRPAPAQCQPALVGLGPGDGLDEQPRDPRGALAGTAARTDPRPPPPVQCPPTRLAPLLALACLRPALTGRFPLRPFGSPSCPKVSCHEPSRGEGKKAPLP